MSPGCWGAGFSAPICEATPVIETRLAGFRMDFCTSHFWQWNADSLERRGLVKLAGHLRDSVEAGVLDADATPATVRAYELRMFL